jgi:hypothetical protein
VAGEPRPGTGREAGRRPRLVLIRRNYELPRGGPTAEFPVSASQGNAPVPDAWIGRSVELVFVSGASTEYVDGDLQEVNERGIVLSVETHVGHPAQRLFYPSSAVIQLSEERDG